MPAHLKDIDAEQVKALAAINCTMDEIAAVLDTSTVTLRARFLAQIEAGRAIGKQSLRRYQWEAAKRGNVTMLIWLGRQLLGQTDKIDFNLTISAPRLEVIEADTGTKTVLELAPSDGQPDTV